MFAMWRYLRGSPGQNGFGSASTAEDVTEGLDLKDYTAIVTGGTAGIGLETVRVLAKRGARVIMAIRNLKLGETVKAEILEEIGDGARVLVMRLDLSDLTSVRKFAAEYKDAQLPLNILVNNGGITSIKAPSNTPDGLELMFATNYVGHFPDGIVVGHHEGNYKGKWHRRTYCDCFRCNLQIHSQRRNCIWQTNQHQGDLGFSGYGQSNLARVLHCRELASRLKDEGVNITINTLHPGAIRTKLTHLDGFLGILSGLTPRFLFKNLAQGAATQVYVATNPGLDGETGNYYIDCNEYPLEGRALDLNLQKKLWKWTQNYINTH